MSNYIQMLFITLIATFFLVSQNSFAQEKNKEKKVTTKKETQIEKVTESSKIWNKVCPVMGEEVDPKVKTVTYKGKVYGFCCKKCIKKFQANPEKYIKNLSEDGTRFLNEE